MDWMLALHHEYAAAYMNYIVEYTETWEQHVKATCRVLQDLRQVGFTAYPKKCALEQLETKYLGVLVGQGQIKPLTDKVPVIKNYKIPQTKKQMRAFLGLASYYRRCIPHFAGLIVPLTNVIKGKGNWIVKLGAKQQKAFEEVKWAPCQDLHTQMFQCHLSCKWMLWAKC